MALVSVQFRNGKSGQFSGREFSYIADVPLNTGDVVNVPTKYGTKEACVCRVNVPVLALQCKVGELRHIKEPAIPCGDLFNGFFD